MTAPTRLPILLSVALLGFIAQPSRAQTPVDTHRNKYTPAQDVQLGREAAAGVEKELPLLRDEQIAAYVNDLGRRLVDAIPAERRVPEFRYSFTVTNQKELNAFALPGGPIYINRGMLEASKTEGEAAGVLAHELSHIVLRHGTAQATAATRFQVGQVAGQILGAIVGGRTGGAIAQGSQFGFGTYFLKYSREFERESDILGAQIVAAAGWDPREMANMFKTLAAQGGSRAPEWMNTHPDPGNRYETITREAALLRVQSRDGSPSREFQAVQARLRSMSAAPSARPGGTTPAPRAGRAPDVAPPSQQYRPVQADLVRIDIPDNWQESSVEGHVTFAPRGAVFESNGASGFTHGVQIGALRTQQRELSQATQELLQLFARSNPQVRVGSSRRDNVSGRPGITTRLSNVSAVTGRPEVIDVTTTQLRDGSLLYVLAVAPEAAARAYDASFRRIRESLQVTDDRLGR